MAHFYTIKKHPPWRLTPLFIAALAMTLGTAPATWAQKGKSGSSSPKASPPPRSSTPRASPPRASRPSPRPSTRAPSRPSSRPSARTPSRPSTRPSTRPAPSRPSVRPPRSSGSSSGSTISGSKPRRLPNSTIRSGPAQGNRPENTTRNPGRVTRDPNPRGTTRNPTTNRGNSTYELPRGGYRSGPAAGTRYQPPDNSGNDSSNNQNPGNHGGGHHGGHHGGYYGGHYGGYSGGHYGYRSPYFGFGLGYSYFPFYLGYSHSPYYYSRLGYSHSPYYRSRYAPRRQRSEAQGALDLNIKPKDTQVYLNGYFIGSVGDFDGWPNYLWIDEDVHELIFYKEGYETVVREISIQPDAVVDLKFRMQPGEAQPAEELTRYFDDREYRSQSQNRSFPRDSRREGERRPDRAPAPDRSQDPSPNRGEPTEETTAETGRLSLTITPPEASVYIDGRFVGIGGELTALDVGLVLDPGEHQIQVFHPSHETYENSFDVNLGEKTELEIGLDSN